MKIALFGGTFDPVHRGHLAVARAAARRFRLDRIYFVPAEVPPHKQQTPLTPYYHRYAMLALATAGEKKFLVSPVEAAGGVQPKGPSYTIETVRRVKRSLGKGDRLFFLIGMDAFREIASWHRPQALLRECEFIVASRPGFWLADVVAALPPGLRPGVIALHVLDGVSEPVSATQVRGAARSGKPLARLVGAAVAEYIRKMGLYRSKSSVASVVSR